MPIYEYSCNDCGQEFEFLLRGDEQPECPSCGQQRLTRMLSVPAAHATHAAPPCPVKNNCGMSNCCGNNCGMSEWMQ